MKVIQESPLELVVGTNKIESIERACAREIEMVAGKFMSHRYFYEDVEGYGVFLNDLRDLLNCIRVSRDEEGNCKMVYEKGSWS
jgi:hypothetical protein